MSKDTTNHICTERCCAESVPGYGGLDQRFVCPHCGDVTNEPRCPHDTPKQDRSGLDI